MSDDKPAKPAPDLLSADGVEDLLAADDRTTVDLYVPEWKKTIRLRQLTGAEATAMSDVPNKEGMLHIVAMSIVDANGNRLFKDPERLRAKSAAALSRIQDAALQLNFPGKGVATAKNG